MNTWLCKGLEAEGMLEWYVGWNWSQTEFIIKTSHTWAQIYIHNFDTMGMSATKTHIKLIEHGLGDWGVGFGCPE